MALVVKRRLNRTRIAKSCTPLKSSKWPWIITTLAGSFHVTTATFVNGSPPALQPACSWEVCCWLGAVRKLPSIDQFHDSCSSPAFRLGRRVEAADMRVRAEKFTDGFFQHSHPVAMNDADTIYRSEYGRIQELINLFDGLFRALPDDVQLPVRNIPAWTC